MDRGPRPASAARFRLAVGCRGAGHGPIAVEVGYLCRGCGLEAERPSEKPKRGLRIASDVE